MLSFILLLQTRLISAVHAFAGQGMFIAAIAALVASVDHAPHLYFSALLTFSLKGLIIPWMLHRLIHQLQLQAYAEHPRHVAFINLAAVGLTLFSYWLVLPIVHHDLTFTRDIVAISLAVILIGLLTMVMRQQAIMQVLGFMSMENGLFLAAVSSTAGMPLVVELGIAFDILVAMVLFGIFFLRIRDSIESLDVDRLNRLTETTDPIMLDLESETTD
jgi:hydrogenase-4 component E